MVRGTLLRFAALVGFLVLALVTAFGGTSAAAQPKITTGQGPALRPAHVARAHLRAPVRPRAPKPQCPVAAPATAAGYQRALDALPEGGDATLSVALPSGRVAWIFADTVIPGVGLPHSTVVMQDAGCFRPTRTQLLPDGRRGTYWWPIGAAALPGGRVLVSAVNGYGVRVRGAICREVGGVLTFDHWLGYWPQPGGRTGVYYDAGLLVDGDRLLVYGTRSAGRYLVFGRELYLATVPLTGLDAGRGWQLGGSPIFGALPHGTDQAVAPYRDAAGYHLVTLLDGVFGHAPVVSLDSTSPAGPFTVRPLFTYARAKQLHYSAGVHPEAKLAGGRVLVTLNNNWPLGDHRLHAVSTYQPSFFATPPATAS